MMRVSDALCSVFCIFVVIDELYENCNSHPYNWSRIVPDINLFANVLALGMKDCSTRSNKAMNLDAKHVCDTMGL